MIRISELIVEINRLDHPVLTFTPLFGNSSWLLYLMIVLRILKLHHWCCRSSWNKRRDLPNIVLMGESLWSDFHQWRHPSWVLTLCIAYHYIRTHWSLDVILILRLLLLISELLVVLLVVISLRFSNKMLVLRLNIQTLIHLMSSKSLLSNYWLIVLSI